MHFNAHSTYRAILHAAEISLIRCNVHTDLYNYNICWLLGYIDWKLFNRKEIAVVRFVATDTSNKYYELDDNDKTE